MKTSWFVYTGVLLFFMTTTSFSLGPEEHPNYTISSLEEVEILFGPEVATCPDSVTKTISSVWKYKTRFFKTSFLSNIEKNEIFVDVTVEYNPDKTFKQAWVYRFNFRQMEHFTSLTTLSDTYRSVCETAEYKGPIPRDPFSLPPSLREKSGYNWT
jgi:hypothetical protein